ncbi:uncharacterized protein Hap1MRO34_022318 [Clarias gariepinus]|uniref:uncharacterized protein LOC128508210 n=1 Tax=Clarias gariepinus TaxID=13013 RepID=UPI00234E1467|nr:uncharacterized protein LOC128508210 [Clarias gariepinus]
MFHNGKWRRVSLIYILSHEKTSEEENKLEIASLVCKQLNCGSAVASLFAENQKDEDGVAAVCTGSESALQECNVLYMSLGSSTGVVCSELLAMPAISFSTNIKVYSQLQGSKVIKGHSFTITCSTEPQFPGGYFHLTVPWMERHRMRAAADYSASFFFPAAAELHQGNYSCVYESHLNIPKDVITETVKWFYGSSVQVFTSESHVLSITVTESPLPAVITRSVLVPFLLFIFCLAIYLYFKRLVSRQDEAALQSENIMLV